MSVLIDKSTRVLVQGITTTEGRQQTSLMLEYKTEVVAGVTPGRYGQEVMGVPVYDKVSEAVKRHKIDVSVIFVPKNAVLNAALEAINEKIPVIVIITGDISVTETIKIKNLAAKNSVQVIGPGSAGILIPDKTKVGIISNEYVSAGEVGIISRSKENEKRLCQSLYKEEVGVSTIISLGGDNIIGTGFVEILKMLEDDEETQVVVIGGETKGRLEEDAARYIQENGYSKPVIAYIFDTGPDDEMAAQKEKLFREAGVTVVDDIWEIGQIIREATIEE
jgi:succinyl-CoA synthetase alpha subunit